MKQATLLVLAAGMGSRYGGLKQIEAVGPNGATLIDYSIYDAIRAGFGKLVFVIRPDIETEFKASIAKNFNHTIPIEYVFQELDMLPAGFTVPPNRSRLWGTGHAILAAKDVINESFAVINADDFYGATSFQLLADYMKTIQDPNGSNYVMAAFVLRHTLSEFGTVSRGICQYDLKNHLEHITELPKIAKDGNKAKYIDEFGKTQTLSGDEIVSMNMWGFTPAIFNPLQHLFFEFLQQRGQEELSEFFIPTAVNTLLSQRQAQVKVLLSPSVWFGVTYQDDRPFVLKKIQHLIAQGIYPENLWS